MKTLQVRTGSYVDSVALMQVSKRVAALDGVRAALVAMGTDLNVELALGMGFEVPEVSANQMLVAVEAGSDDALATALAEVDAALAATGTTGSPGFGSAPVPVTIRSAARASSRAGENPTVALVSTPGQYAFADAIDAVDSGLLTMVFSDNVPLEQEVALKRYADRADVLVMGPDCGTAVLGGVGLGFANVVRPGPVGIVAASGTGAQHLMCLLDAADVGVSHCLGVGGRDLSEPVGGLSTLRALDLLAADEGTEIVVVVSKPPAAAVAEAVRGHAATLGKPVVFALLGAGQPDLTEAARSVVEAAGATWADPKHWPGALARGRGTGSLRGLFAGGTLCDEAMLAASQRLGPIASNIPLDPAWALGADLSSTGHTMIDFGDDRLTQGRPHPMIDGSLRADRLLAEVADPNTSVVLLDVVLGLAAHPDPASELVDPIRHATEAGVPVVAAVVGTRDDPQGLQGRVDALHDAGAWVFLSNAAATRAALDLLATDEGADS
jgi:FdrA protein